MAQPSPPSTPPSPLSMIKHQLTQLQDSMKGIAGPEPHRSPPENDRPRAGLPKTHANRSSPYKPQEVGGFEDKASAGLQGNRVWLLHCYNL